MTCANIKILVADARPNVRDLVSLCASTCFGSDRRVEVLKAQDGASAVSILSQEAVDLVITGAQLPDMQAKEIVASFPVAQVRYLIFDEPLDPKTLLELVQLGVTSFLERPMGAAQLKEAIREAVQCNDLARRIHEALPATLREELNGFKFRVERDSSEPSDQPKVKQRRVEHAPLFVEVMVAHLDQCHTAWCGLSDPNQVSKQLGYLFQVIERIHCTAQLNVQLEMVALCESLRALIDLIYVEPEKLGAIETELIGRSIAALRNYVSGDEGPTINEVDDELERHLLVHGVSDLESIEDAA